LLPRQAPDLSDVGRRTYVGWLYQWLLDPHKLSPSAAMPRLFADDEAGRLESYAVAVYLESLGGPLRPVAERASLDERQARYQRGRRLFLGTGCGACHDSSPQKKDNTTLVRVFPLPDLGSKTTPDKLAAYLRDPLAVDPSGRMPNLVLDGKEALDLAGYLCDVRTAPRPPQLPPAPAAPQKWAAFQRVDPRPEELAAFKQLPPERQWLDLGKRLVMDKGCNNCHTIAPGGQPFANFFADASFDDLKNPQAHAAGCLATEPGKRGKAPWFRLGADERRPLKAFLRAGAAGAGAPAPLHSARVALQRFNCLACHGYNGQGGLSPGLVEALRRHEKAEHPDGLLPPPLTGVGHKLRTPWLRQVLTGAGKARPWMGLRMPQYGAAHVGKLPEALAALEGAEPDDAVFQAAKAPARLEAGRLLVGTKGFGCIACHDLAGKPSTGTRGPDLATSHQRVRYEWYRRWLESAARMQPGTRMPTVFPDGKSTLATVLGGSADAQAEALWAYLSQRLAPTPPAAVPPCCERPS
jgi:cytochrome c553